MRSGSFRLLQTLLAAGAILAAGLWGQLMGGCKSPEVGTPAKIRLMANALRAREQGDLIAAQKAVEDLELLAPADPAVQRLRREVNAQIAAMQGVTSELQVEAAPAPGNAVANPEFVPVDIPGMMKREEPADYAARKVGFFTTRGHVGSGDRNLTATFTVEHPDPQLVLIRGLGPSLRTPNRKRGFLAQPRVELLDSNNRIVGTNSDWRKSGDPSFIAAMVQAAGGVAFDAASNEAAIVATLAPGGYSVRLGSVRGRSGIGVIEIYQFTP